MSKNFSIHPSISLVKDTLVFFSYLCIVICWLIPNLLQGPFLIFQAQLIRFAFYMSLTLLLILYLTRTVFITIRDTLYILSEDKLIKRNPFKMHVIPLSEVTAFRFIQIPLGFGFGYIKTSSKKLRLTFLIDNLVELIQLLEVYLSKENGQSIFKSSEIEAFKHQARIADFHLRETFTIIKPLTYLIFGFLILGTVTTFWFWRLPLLFAIAWIIFSVTVPCIGFLVAYTVITKAISRQLTQSGSIAPEFDTSRIYSFTALITACTYLLIGIIFKNIWSYFWL